jgi:thymidine kinase
MTPMLFTPKLDDRYGTAWIKSRIGLQARATIFTSEDDLFEAIRAQLEERNIHCVLVDEAQFLSRDQVYQLSEIVDRLNIPVLCFGLRTDFQGELFEGSKHLLAWADELAEIKTICHTGRKATMVVRVDDDGYAIKEGAQVEIGGNERYVSVSRAEFKKVFVGGQRIKFIEPVESDAEDHSSPEDNHKSNSLI